ncbi:ABC transporter ATP-binding protein [Micrococcales bacterium 31B]|nr:ABC transporter ATP-binding protein [Micrococcales bacterium 31B]
MSARPAENAAHAVTELPSTVAVAHVSARYGTREVLHDISFDVAPGQHVAILGASGSGKSTLLKIIGGQLAPSTGQVSLPEGARTATVFQDPHLMPWLNVRENIGFSMRLARHRDRVTGADLDDLISLLGLGHVAHAKPSQLSGGQAQRVAFARALVTRPSLLLLDEPFSALDPATRRDVQSWLREVAAVDALTKIFVTHDLDEALYLAERIIVINDGRITHDLENPDAVAHEDLAAHPLRAALLGAYASQVHQGASA